MVALAPPMPVALTRATSPSPPTVTLADPPPRVTSLRTVVVVTVPLVTALLPPTVSVTPPADAVTLPALAETVHSAPFRPGPFRSDERRVGKECVRTGRSRGWPYH